MPNPRLNPLPTALLVALVAAAITLLAPTQASAQTLITDAEVSFVDAVNAERAAVGSQPLVVYPSMTDAAREWAFDMASREVLEHAANLTGGAPPGWVTAGENVGRGGTISGLMSAFMNSEGHRKNLLDPSFTHIGVGVYLTDSNVIYTTHRFAGVPDGGAVTPTQPAPTAAPIPPTPVPPTPVPPTPVPTATPVPPTPVPPTPTPAPPTPTPVPPPPTPDPGLGEAPNSLAFVDPDQAPNAGAAMVTQPPATFKAATSQIVERFSWLVELLTRLFGGN